jgi:hypothetical protein
LVRVLSKPAREFLEEPSDQAQSNAKGDWSIDDLINMLSHRSMGLGINCLNLPLSIINTGEDGIKVDAHNMVMSFLERKEQDASFLCCAGNETWDNAKSKPLLIEMSVLSKQLSTLLSRMSLLAHGATFSMPNPLLLE